ncbi:antibiotic biosynthesis monooxygenase family protein [Amycolatopsis thailandensis]|uniref:antibiotic biosynthesis monooxygenase family protein n=1 Tax=Amycolatopsis thailandensis TaxID=589330 RepID=UPI0036669408
MSGRVRVLVWHRAGTSGADPIADAYHEVSRELLGVPGLLGNELLGAAVDRDVLVVMSEWESMEAFSAWEKGAGHRGTTAPLRPFRDHTRPVPFDVLTVLAEYPGAAT